MIMFVIIAVLSVFVFYLMRDKYEAHAKKEMRRQRRATRRAQRRRTMSNVIKRATRKRSNAAFISSASFGAAEPASLLDS
jgi:hypothetical protein